MVLYKHLDVYSKNKNLQMNIYIKKHPMHTISTKWIYYFYIESSVKVGSDKGGTIQQAMSVGNFSSEPANVEFHVPTFCSNFQWTR